jgi:hypothetical protein
MKSLFSTILFGLVLTSTGSAQNSSGVAKLPFLIGVVAPPSQQTGNSNYLLSLSEKDYKSKIYVFYTDSNATVAHLTINGVNIRLIGGPNPEHIMAYVNNNYTVTLSPDKKVSQPSTNSDDESNFEMSATLAIYNRKGQVVLKKVTGSQTNRVKN